MFKAACQVFGVCCGNAVLGEGDIRLQGRLRLFLRCKGCRCARDTSEYDAVGFKATPMTLAESWDSALAEDGEQRMQRYARFVDWFLARPGIPNYVVDVRGVPGDPAVARWLAAEMPMRSIGSGYSVKSPEAFFGPTRIDRDYDGLVVFGTTTRARPNPTGMRPKPTVTK